MNEKEQKSNIKELTEEEFKSTIAETIKESALSKTIEDVKKSVKDLNDNREVSEDEKMEKAAIFVKKLLNPKKFGNFTEEEVKTITTDSGSFGYTVPTELAKAVAVKKDKIAKIRARAFVFKMAGKFQLPYEGTGVTSYWVTTEADTDITESDPTVTKKDLDDYYLVSRVRVPYKLLDTAAINIVNYISQLAGRSLASTEESAFVAGDGSGKPTGIRQATISSAAQAGANLAYDDLVDLYYDVPEQYRANASFLTSPAGMKLIRKLKDTNGLPVFNVNDNTIFGRPLLESTDIPSNLGSGTDETEIYFGDLKEYWIKDGQTAKADSKKVPARLQVDLYLYEAVDGVVVNTDAFRKLTGVK